MLNVLKATLAGGRVTTEYPHRPAPAPALLRGAPTIDPDRCDCSAACVEACPASAITLTPERPEGHTWQLDLARCVFCAECVAACPTGALTMSGQYELATRSRADLLTIVRHGQPAAPLERGHPGRPGQVIRGGQDGRAPNA